MKNPSRAIPSTASKKKALTAIVREATHVSEAGRRRGEALLALIERRKARIVEDFYDIGVALHEIQKKKLFVALGCSSFAELLDKRVHIGRSQALKLVHVAASFERDEALELGLEKAYALVRYTEATPEPDSPRFLLETGAKLGKKRLADASLREVVAATRAVRAKTRARGDAKDPEAAASARSARKLQATLRKRGARSAIVAAMKTKAGWRLRIEIAMSEAGRV